jgi:hypothetical protein
VNDGAQFPLNNTKPQPTPNTMNPIKMLSACLLTVALATAALAKEQPAPETLPAGQHMYVIERDMPGLGKLTPAELKAAAQKSCEVLRALGPKVTWLHSYVTGDKMYCVYLAPSEAVVREHAKEGGFPATAVNQVSTIISPKTAE